MRLVPASEQDRALLVAWIRDRDRRARDELTRNYLPFARSIARRFAMHNEPIDDLEQIASIGLLKAIDRYDLERDVALTTYAMPTIVGELRRHFRDRVWAVHIPRGIQDLAVRVNRTTGTLTTKLGRSPTVAEIAKELERSEEDISEAIASLSSRHAQSLHEASDSEHDRFETLGDVELGYTDVEDRLLLSPALAELEERELTILRLRFADGLSQSQIAARIGISQMHVSRLLRRTLAQLEASLAQ